MNIKINKESIEEKIRENLIKAHDISGLTSYKISKITGISQATLSRYESGERIPMASHLALIAQAHGVSVDWLCGLKDTP